MSILESKNHAMNRLVQGLRMVKKGKLRTTKKNNIASDTRGDRWATISRNHVWDGEAFVHAQKSRGATKKHWKNKNAIVYVFAKSTCVIMCTFPL